MNPPEIISARLFWSATWGGVLHDNNMGTTAWASVQVLGRLWPFRPFAATLETLAIKRAIAATDGLLLSSSGGSQVAERPLLAQIYRQRHLRGTAAIMG